jgi:nucleotide-binding universal stress UspA family protein
MRVLHPVATEPTPDAAISLVTRLGFASLEVTVASVLQRVAEPVWLEEAASANLVARFLAEQERVAHQSLDAAATLYATRGAKAERALVSGFTAASLQKLADDGRFDLVALVAGDKTRLDRLFAGSVSRALVSSAPQSVLVAKGEVKPSGRVDVVVATDHSPACNRAIDRFLSWAPGGLGEVTIMSAFSDELVEALAVAAPTADVDWADVVRAEIDKKNFALLERFRPFATTLRSSVRAEKPDVAIALEMRERSAELLILGAQGHGFFERAALGSVSFRQVSEAATSTLVLRG